MATNEKIKLDITSAFDPGGFAKANNAVRDLGGEMKKGGKVAGNLMNAFGDLGDSLGGVTSSISKLGDAFRGGGWIALAAAGVAFLVTKFIELKDAAAKAAEDQRRAWKDDLFRRMDSDLSDLKTKHAQIADEIERGAKNAEKMAKAYEALAKSEIGASNAADDAKVAELEGQKQAALFGVTDPNERKAIELSFEKKISEVKKEAAKFDRDQKEDLARKKVADSEKGLESEKAALASLRDEIAVLQEKLSVNEQDAWNKKNPMPRLSDGKTDLKLMGGALLSGNVAGALAAAGKAYYSQNEYEKAMDQWIKESGEFTKENEPRRKEIADSLAKKQAEIKDKEASVAAKNTENSSLKQDFSNTLDSNIAATRREYNVDDGLTNGQKEINKALEEQKLAIQARNDVEQKIFTLEENILCLKEEEQDRQEKRNTLIQNSQQAKSMGAVGWQKDQTDKADAQEALDKSNQKESKWVENAKNRMATGAKLNKKELARIANFDEWDKNQIEQPNEKKAIDNIKDRSKKGFFVSEKDKLRVQKFDEFQKDRKKLLDPGDPQKQMLTKMQEQITELKGLRTDLQNSLKVN